MTSTLLLAVPGYAWNRLLRERERVLPHQCLSKVNSVSALAALDQSRHTASDGVYCRIWLGLLKPQFEPCLNADEFTHPIFPTEDDQERYVPYARSLVELADDFYHFLSAESGAPQREPKVSRPVAQPDLNRRIDSLESGMHEVLKVLQNLTAPAQGTTTKPRDLPASPKPSISLSLEMFILA